MRKKTVVSVAVLLFLTSCSPDAAKTDKPWGKTPVSKPAADLQKCHQRRLIATAPLCDPPRSIARPNRAFAEPGADGHNRPQPHVSLRARTPRH